MLWYKNVVLNEIIPYADGTNHNWRTFYENQLVNTRKHTWIIQIEGIGDFGKYIGICTGHFDYVNNVFTQNHENYTYYGGSVCSSKNKGNLKQYRRNCKDVIKMNLDLDKGILTFSINDILQDFDNIDTSKLYRLVYSCCVTGKMESYTNHQDTNYKSNIIKYIEISDEKINLYES